ncbi:MAG: amidohydrolase [Desulfobacterales bacterium]|nr:amidohydrolase [Desulfobacterales bacterium]
MKIRWIIAVSVVSVMVMFFSTSVFKSLADTDKADVVLKNGKIVTLEPSRPQAEALAIKGRAIRAIGTTRDIEAFVDPATTVIDLEGRLAIPGFIEGHGHLLALGQVQMMLDLSKAQNWDEIVAMVAEAAQQVKPGRWIQGWGWHQEKWDKPPTRSIDGLPTHHELSKVSPQNPVYLSHASGHASFVNAKALELAGIGPDTPDPPGGEIVRDHTGRPTGMLREAAQALVKDAFIRYQTQRPSREIKAEQMEQIRLAMMKALAHGVTTFHDCGSSLSTIDLFRQLADEGRLLIRLYVMIKPDEGLAEKLPAYRLIDYGNDYLTVRSIKLYMDGALGSHGAWLLEPYQDKPESTGFAAESIEKLTRTAELGIQHGFQVNTHAIGDRANREILDIYEKVFQVHPEKKDLRWRIEHAQHIHPDDISRFAALGVTASIQGIHATSDAPWVVKRIGEKRARESAYVWRKLWDSNAVVSNGTDTPVEDIDPISNFYATVTRRMRDGSTFFPEQRLTREEALKSYTINNAYAAFEENIKGTLKPGKPADIVVLSEDIMTIPEDHIRSTRVDYTIIDGKIAYTNHEAMR